MHNIIAVRGGGDIATGCVQKLYRAGFGVVVLETPRPTAIRRSVSLSEAVYQSLHTVEDMTAQLAAPDEVEHVLGLGRIPVVIDPAAELMRVLRPLAVVDAILAKRNLGTHRGMAGITIGLGPGFTAPDDVNVVIETMRGHNLGRLIFKGAAMANTATPAPINGVSSERVVYAPVSGTLHCFCGIGDTVAKAEPIAAIGDVPVSAPIDGVLRGILPDGFSVSGGLKLADIDPRLSESQNCFTISDKSRAIGGAVLEAVLHCRRMESISEGSF